jgi:hypothetical protein
MRRPLVGYPASIHSSSISRALVVLITSFMIASP